MPLSGIDPRQTCRAWVSFGGAGALWKAYGVASVTRNGIGDYTIVFSSAFQDVNFSMQATVESGVGVGFAPRFVMTKYGTRAVGQVGVICEDQTGAVIDPQSISLAFFD